MLDTTTHSRASFTHPLNSNVRRFNKNIAAGSGKYLQPLYRLDSMLDYGIDVGAQLELPFPFRLDIPYATQQEMVVAVRQLETGMRAGLPGAPLPRNHRLTDLQRRGLMENLRRALNVFYRNLRNGFRLDHVRSTLKIQLSNPRFRFITQISGARTAIRVALDRR
jgi:hypothetical protein